MYVLPVHGTDSENVSLDEKVDQFESDENRWSGRTSVPTFVIRQRSKVKEQNGQISVLETPNMNNGI